MFKGRFPTFSLTTPNNKWISLSPNWTNESKCCKSIFLQIGPTMIQYGATNINDNNTYNNDGYSRKDMIICWTSTKRWLHSPCYWDVWVSSSLFWFIFYYLCTDHYYASSTVFFSPLDACFLLSITRVHSPTMCACHNDSSMGCFTWLGFSSLPHIIISAPLSLADLWQMTAFSS
jgi:hypothetical protein